MAEASLIPKQNLAAQRDIGGGFNLFFNISLVFFLISVLVSGGLFLFKQTTETNLTNRRNQLERILVNDFPQQTIEDHERVSKAMQASRILLSAHEGRYRSDIFALIEKNVLPDVTFSTFTFTEKGNDLFVSLAGTAASYKTVADQVSVIQELDEVSSAGFSNLSLTGEGLVNFSMRVTLKPTKVAPNASSALGGRTTEPAITSQ